MGLIHLDAVKEIAKANAKAMYEDAAQPSVRVVGKAVAQCASLFATPVGRIAEIFEGNLHKYIDKLEGINEAELVEPDTRILVPVLEKLRYTDDDLVSDYYTQILASASIKDQSKKVLVTFIEILNRLSADELKILEYMNSADNYAQVEKLTAEEAVKYQVAENSTRVVITGGFPILDVNMHKKGEPDYVTLARGFNLISRHIKLAAPENISVYIDNLASLGLVEKEDSKSYSLFKMYDFMKKDAYIKKIESEVDSKYEVKFVNGRVDITNLGLKLLNLGMKIK